eukprot:5212883-Amphidinium_carterae.1
MNWSNQPKTLECDWCWCCLVCEVLWLGLVPYGGPGEPSAMRRALASVLLEGVLQGDLEKERERERGRPTDNVTR